MSRRLFNLLVVLALFLGTPSFSLAQTGGGPQIPVQDASGLAIPQAEILPVDVSPELSKAKGPVQIVVRLTDDPLAVAIGEDVKQDPTAKLLNSDQERAYLNGLDDKQNTLLNQIGNLGGKSLGQMRKALNAVIVEVDASRIPEIAALPDVASIHQVINYEENLSETVPYIGATALQVAGVDGTGVRVAVLDSGIDYTHRNLGGSGSVDEYNANDPTTIEPGTFPTWKVVGGYDFVGNNWDGSLTTPPLAPDPDPLDSGPGGGHGTHVADIIAGKSLDGTHVGVAPGASLYAVKVCSSVTTACSGVALLQGMEFALDPNGDGDISDAVDVINMSLGSNYGQFEDDLSAASNNAVRMGVVVVAAAGNAADRPYIVSSPSTAERVISVAETQVPSAKLYPIVAGSVTVGGKWQAWSPEPVAVSSPLQYGDGAGGNLLGCDPFPAGSLADKVVLVDRGTCNISAKAANASAGGAVSVIIANNAPQGPGDLPPDFSYGGGTVTIPAYTVTRADGLLLKQNIGQTTTIDPAAAASLVMNMVSSSARGPSYSYNTIKPDLGAPGASVSAVYGTGTEEEAFGGTSGATPMVSGSAALLIQKFPKIRPFEVKVRLMNTGETNIGINPVALPGELAPITRIGGGEVRVDQAAAAITTAWDTDSRTGSLSFGYYTLAGNATFTRSISIHNYDTQAHDYQVDPEFRYADDAASGAIQFKVPNKVTVPSRSIVNFNIQLSVDASKLPTWTLNGGAFGGDGYRLQSVEFDGYINITNTNDSADRVHLAWQILPHKAANVTAAPENVNLKNGVGKVNLMNPGGAIDGNVDVFSLLGTSGQIPKKQLPKPGDNFAVIDLKSFGARLVGLGADQSDNPVFGIQFAINTYDVRAHPNYPAEFDVYLDVNRDGIDDYVLFNAENGGFGVTGQSLVYVFNLKTMSATPYFYNDADLNSSNAIFTVPLSVLGMTPLTQFDVSVYAFDNYFTGNLTDSIIGMTYTAGAPRFFVDQFAPVVPTGGSVPLAIFALPGGDISSPSQTGLLLLYRDAELQSQADTIFVKP